jgi:hypothetical protein
MKIQTSRKIEMRKIGTAFPTIFILLLLTACGTKSTCPTPNDPGWYLSPLAAKTPFALPTDDPSLPTAVKIGGRSMMVDKIVSGPLCNDQWKGTVYVTCDVQVNKWEVEPLFLKDCNLSIEPGTVVYVADHNDAAYYNGCSCHTGEQP